jgi:hypothetical protein
MKQQHLPPETMKQQHLPPEPMKQQQGSYLALRYEPNPTYVLIQGMNEGIWH